MSSVLHTLGNVLYVVGTCYLIWSSLRVVVWLRHRCLTCALDRKVKNDYVYLDDDMLNHHQRSMHGLDGL